MPDDPEYKNLPDFPWEFERKLINMSGQANIPKPSGYKLEIHGFFLVDKRRNPPVAIFKNCEVPMAEGVRPTLFEEPVPFMYLGEALDYRRRMHLSSREEAMDKPVALAPEPPLGQPRPDTIWMSKDELKNR